MSREIDAIFDKKRAAYLARALRPAWLQLNQSREYSKAPLPFLA